MTMFLQIVTVGVVLVGIAVVTTLKERIETMSAALNRLTAEVAENTNTTASAKALISGLAQQIRDNAGNETALNKLADELDASGADLAGAVAENTPAADETDPA